MRELLVSVIIPTLNEEETIESLLIYLKQIDHRLELIVVDAGSSDRTVVKAKKFSQVIESSRGRGVQMNRGASAASGDVLWFLHADCRPHPESISVMKNALLNPDIVGGAFEFTLDQPGFHYRLAQFFSNLKNQLLRLVYGDMGIFIRREIFEKMGGFKEIPLMEDMDFCRRLKKMGKIKILRYRIKTSARRWVEEGYVKNIVRNWMLQIAWVCGASPYKLVKWYKFK